MATDRGRFTSEEELEYARALSLSSLHSGGWQADLHTDLLMSASPGDADMTQLIGTLIDKQKAAETSIQVLHSAGAALPTNALDELFVSGQRALEQLRDAIHAFHSARGRDEENVEILNNQLSVEAFAAAEQLSKLLEAMHEERQTRQKCESLAQKLAEMPNQTRHELGVLGLEPNAPTPAYDVELRHGRRNGKIEKAVV